MKKIAGILILIMLFGALIVGCQSENPEEANIKAVIEENLEAFNNEDVDKYMETIGADSEVYEMTKATMESLFESYELKAEIESMEVIEIKEDTAKVRVVQISKKIEGPEFKDNKITAIQNLKKVDGEWKIDTTEVENMEYLD